MISFKQYLLESNLEADIEIKKKLANEAEESLKNSEDWKKMSQSERESAIREARKKAESDYDSLPEEEKQKKRDEHNQSKGEPEPTDEELDNEIKKQLADEAEKKLADDEFWASKTDAEKEAAIKDARKKAEDDYNNLSDDDKKKKRDEQKESRKKQNDPNSQEPTDEEVDKEIKKKLADDAEEEARKEEGFDDQTPEYQESKIKDAREKAEKDYDNLSDDEKKKKRGEHKESNKKTEPTGEGDKTGKEDKTGNGDKTGKGDKTKTKVSAKQWLEEIKKLDETLANGNKEGEGVYNTFKDLSKGALTAFAICCPVGVLAVAGTALLGGVIIATIKACKENKMDDTGKEVLKEVESKVKESGDKELIKQMDDAKKSAIGKDGEILSPEEIDKNAKENGLEDVVEKVEEEKKKGFFDKIKDKLAGIKLGGKTEEETEEKTEDELKQELKDKYKDSENIPDNLKGEDGKLDPNKIDELTGDDLKKATKDVGIESKKEPNDPKEPKELSNDDIEKMQDDMADLDPEKDKDKIKEIEDQLKDAAKKAGKDESEYLMKTDTDKDGKHRQRKTGPRGGKYYRVKGDDGWGDWISGEPNESLSAFLQSNINIINENKNKKMKLSEYLYESLSDDARELFIKVISEDWDEKLYNKLSKKVGVFTPNNQQLFSFMKGLYALVKKRVVKENLNLNWIDTSNITSMYMMFKGKKVMFDTTKWNTSNVTNFTECFADAQVHKNTIENWDMSSADALPYMFADATVNCDLSKWVIDKTKYPRYINIFKNCKIDKKHYPMMKDMDGSTQQMNEYFGLD